MTNQQFIDANVDRPFMLNRTLVVKGKSGPKNYRIRKGGPIYWIEEKMKNGFDWTYHCELTIGSEKICGWTLMLDKYIERQLNQDEFIFLKQEEPASS